MSDFCNRVHEGQMRTCQQIGAQKKYNEKMKTNKAVALFRKYYKRYYERTKVRLIKPEDFKQWNYKAVEMRVGARAGK